MSGALLIALDIDGTLVHEDDTLSPRVADAVAAVVAAGHTIVPATGRSFSATNELCVRLGQRPGRMVCANGAVVFERAGEGYVASHVETFDPTEVLARIREGLPDASYLVEDADGKRRYTRGMLDWDLDYADEVEFEALGGDEVMRVVVMSPDHAVEDFLHIVDGMGLHQVSYAIGYSSWLDIAPDGVNKATGLARVAAELGFEREQIVAIGDGRNDIEMFEWVAAGGGRAIAMGQAPAEVVAASNEQTSTVADDGAALVLEALLAS